MTEWYCWVSWSRLCCCWCCQFHFESFPPWSTRFISYTIHLNIWCVTIVADLLVSMSHGVRETQQIASNMVLKSGHLNWPYWETGWLRLSSFQFSIGLLHLSCSSSNAEPGNTVCVGDVCELLASVTFWSWNVTQWQEDWGLCCG
jgi:hypothetical protein